MIPDIDDAEREDKQVAEGDTDREVGSQVWLQCYLLTDLARRVTVHATGNGRRYAEWMVLRYLTVAPTPATSVAAIARHWGTETSAIWGIVDRLLAEGAIERVDERVSGRRAHFHRITEHGLAILAREDPLWEMAERLDRIDPRQRRGLMRLLPLLQTVLNTDPIGEGDVGPADRLMELLSPTMKTSRAPHAKLAEAIGGDADAQWVRQTLRDRFGTSSLPRIRDLLRQDIVQELLSEAADWMDFRARLQERLPGIGEEAVLKLVDGLGSEALARLAKLRADLGRDEDLLVERIERLCFAVDTVERLGQALAEEGRPVGIDQLQDLLQRRFGSKQIRGIRQLCQSRAVERALGEAQTMAQFRAALERTGIPGLVDSALRISDALGPEALKRYAELRLAAEDVGR